MIKARELTLNYLEHYPSEAARVLEALDVATAAALMETTPSRLCAPVLAQMAPTLAARCLEPLADDQAVTLIRRLGPQHGAAILRFLGDARRNRLLAQLPAGRALAYRLLIGFPEDSIGAWIEPDVLTLAGDTRVGEAIRMARDHEGWAAQTLYVVNQKRALRGIVALQQLLRTNADMRLDYLMEPISHTLPAQAFMAGIRDHVGWETSSALPVVDHDGRFIGILNHSTLMRALKLRPSEGGHQSLDSTLASVTAMYWLGFSAVLRALVSTLPGRPRAGSAPEHTP